jgi:glycosyltransferase involved in cell wall biosynthesis
MLSYNERGKGTWLRAYKLGQELVKLGHQLTLVSSEMSNKKSILIANDQPGFSEIVFPPTLQGKSFHGWDLPEAFRRLTWLKDENFDLIHVFEHRPTNHIPAVWAHKKGALLVSDWADWLGRGGSIEERRNLVLKTFLSYPETRLEESGRKKSIGCTAINQTLYQKARTLGFPKDKILLLPNGYFNSQLTSTPIKEARKRLGIAENIFLVGYLGTSFISDSLLMQDTFDNAINQDRGIKFLQIGQNKFVPKNVINLINTGPVSIEKLSLFLSVCNVFWLPMADVSANRGRSPYKFGDYLTIGRPIVSTDVGDQADLIREHKLGLITEFSGQSLFDAIRSLESDSESCEQFGVNAYKFARLAENSWEDKSKKLNEFYYGILKGF